jgi:hypothetical protein
MFKKIKTRWKTNKQGAIYTNIRTLMAVIYTCISMSWKDWQWIALWVSWRYATCSYLSCPYFSVLSSIGINVAFDIKEEQSEDVGEDGSEERGGDIWR